MASKIQPLPSEVVHLIAAGEVIDSLAAVVRELAENAIDSGATRIALALWPDQWRIRSADNGAGMDLSDLQRAATPHSTSKIRQSDDLWNITSLGFRGEALHSLAQLSDLEIFSRPVDASEGWQVTYNAQGEPAQVKTVAIAPGTVVTATNIFGIWPARRQGLPSVSQQMKAVQTTIYQLALCHPHITWQIEQNDKPWFAIAAGGSAKAILAQILRDVRFNDLQAWQAEASSPDLATGLKVKNDTLSSTVILQENPSRIELVLGLPDRCHRHRPDWVRVAVNGRGVRSPELEQTILGAFRRILPRDRYPICFLHLHISPTQVDWNRHPAKAEVYLHHLDHWQAQITQAIGQALRLSPANLPEALHSERVSQLLKTAETQGTYQVQRQIQAKLSTNNEAPEELPLRSLRAVAQIHKMYVLAEHSSGLWLVEQHIAHERVLYEQLCDRWQIVSLEPPLLLSQLSTAQVEQLQRLQLEVELFGEQVWAVRTAPALLAQRPDCAEALLELSLGGDLQAALVATACRSAIRNGTDLTLPEMQTLLDQWQKTRHPRTCPHGRPIYLSLEESALSRFFRRHWVIGKSHGI